MHHTSVTPNVVVERWTLLLRIRELPGSNPGPETDYPDRGFRRFHQSLHVNVRAIPWNLATIASFQIFCTSSFTFRHFIRRYKTNSVSSELEGSSPCLQEPATGPYPELTESTPPPANLPNIHSDPIFPSTPRSSEWSLFVGLSHQNLVYLVPAHLILLDRLSSSWFDLPNIALSTRDNRSIYLISGTYTSIVLVFLT
jgi:hypothetical protein